MVSVEVHFTDNTVKKYEGYDLSYEKNVFVILIANKKETVLIPFNNVLEVIETRK